MLKGFHIRAPSFCFKVFSNPQREKAVLKMNSLIHISAQQNIHCGLPKRHKLQYLCWCCSFILFFPSPNGLLHLTEQKFLNTGSRNSVLLAIKCTSSCSYTLQSKMHTRTLLWFLKIYQNCSRCPTLTIQLFVYSQVGYKSKKDCFL